MFSLSKLPSVALSLSHLSCAPSCPLSSPIPPSTTRRSLFLERVAASFSLVAEGSSLVPLPSVVHPSYTLDSDSLTISCSARVPDSFFSLSHKLRSFSRRESLSALFYTLPALSFGHEPTNLRAAVLDPSNCSRSKIKQPARLKNDAKAAARTRECISRLAARFSTSCVYVYVV